jgi:hypothetical protein
VTLKSNHKPLRETPLHGGGGGIEVVLEACNSSSLFGFNLSHSLFALPPKLIVEDDEDADDEEEDEHGNEQSFNNNAQILVINNSILFSPIKALSILLNFKESTEPTTSANKNPTEEACFKLVKDKKQSWGFNELMIELK